MDENVVAQDRTHFPAHVRYRLVALVCAGLVALFGWELSRTFDWGYLFFLLICLGLGISNLLDSTSYVRLSRRGISLHRPFRPAEAVEFRQLSGVAEEGRLTRAISIQYHPLAERPLVDLDSVRSLTLPVVHDQATLLATLERQAPS